MFLAAAIVLSLVVAWALGARLTRLAELRLRGAVFVFGALAVQLVIFTPLAEHGPARLNAALHALTYVALLGFLALNLRHPGLWLAGLGLVSNATVIFANNGRMPITLEAWTTTGRAAATITRTGFYNNNVLAGPHAHLSVLGDVFALPASLPLATALSIGDLLILFGMITFIYRAGAGTSGARAASLLDPLRSSDFRRLLVGRGASRLGDLLTMTAVVTWLFARTHSTVLVSAFLIARIAAAGGGAFLAAPLLNRLPRFHTLSLVELGRGLITAAALPLAVMNQVAPVIALVCLSALVGAATSPSAASLIPDLLPDRALQAGNGLHGGSQNLVMVVGAALGGFSVVQFGIGTALGIDLATFGLAALLYRQFSQPNTAVPVEPDPDLPRRALLQMLLRDRVLFGLSASFAIVTAAMGVLNASLPAFFTAQIEQPRAYGYAMAAIGAGLLCGELLTSLVRQEHIARRSVGIAFFLSAASVLVLSRTHVAATAYLLLFLLGASDGSTEIVRDTLFQRRLPRRARAGGFAIASALQNAGMVLGLAAAAAILAAAPSTAALTASAAGCLAGAFIAALALARHRRLGALPVADDAPAPA